MHRRRLAHLCNLHGSAPKLPNQACIIRGPEANREQTRAQIPDQRDKRLQTRQQNKNGKGQSGASSPCQITEAHLGICWQRQREPNHASGLQGKRNHLGSGISKAAWAG